MLISLPSFRHPAVAVCCMALATCFLANNSCLGFQAPMNDDFNDSMFTGGLPLTLMGNNVGATVEPDEQQLELTDNTVWWFFLAPVDGMVTVNTFGSDFDTVLHIFDGFAPAVSVADLNPVTDNDQAGGTDQSEVTFAVVMGAPYEIRVGGVMGAEGNIVLNVAVADDVLLGDVNCDGVIDLLDIQPFVTAVTNNVFDEKADINGDGDDDLLDIAGFVQLLIDG